MNHQIIRTPDINSGLRTEYYDPNFTLKIRLQHEDIRWAYKFMQVELYAYNLVVTHIGAQFRRDKSVLRAMSGEHVKLFGEMCASHLDIYTNKEFETYPDGVKKYRDVFIFLDDKTRFLFTEASKLPNMIPEVKRRIGITILEYFIQLTKDHDKNERHYYDEVTEYFGDVLDNPLSIIAEYSELQKHHLQIPRECLTFVYDKDHNLWCNIPYLKKPVAIFPRNFDPLKSSWNYVYLRQESEAQYTKAPWIMDFRKQTPTFYDVQFLDRFYLPRI